VNTGNQSGKSRRELRKARKLAEQRQRAWDAIRASQEIDHAHGNTVQRTGHVATPGPVRPPLLSTPTGSAPVATAAEVAHQNPSDLHQADTQPTKFLDRDTGATARGSLLAALLAVLEPVTLAFTLVLLLVAGTPLVTGSWNIAWLAGSGIATVAFLLLYPRASRGAGRATRSVGLILAALVGVAGLVGIVGQNVVEGRAQIRGSATDRAVEEHRELTAAAEVLSENQGLLSLPPEQAIPLGTVYAEARRQAILIGERWNPATNGTPPVPELAEAYALLNLAAAQQTAAIDGFVANLENPEPALETEYVERGIAVREILENDLPPVLAKIERVIRNSVTDEGKP
jgi:hypothetical protein